jgi:hypothetical protein
VGLVELNRGRLAKVGFRATEPEFQVQVCHGLQDSAATVTVTVVSHGRPPVGRAVTAAARNAGRLGSIVSGEVMVDHLRGSHCVLLGYNRGRDRD